ncbi:MAG TPA: carbonic anhydrase [Stellaceae bacterium]|nr:carbonic anhydrase [Stellaceae bacterium]
MLAGEQEQNDSTDCRGDCERRGVAAAPLPRRNLLAIGATAGALAVVGSTLAVPLAARAQTMKSPAEALQALMDGNRRFVARKLTFYQEDLAILQQNTAEKQEPFASVLSCADSRVPVELIFDQSIGHVFVNRVAGNIATTEIIASIEYGAAVLGTRVIVVLAHRNCGAVKATIDGKAVPGQISSLYRYIRPAVNQAGADLRAATEANAKIQAQLLKESSPVLGSLVKEGKLAIVAAFFDVQSGKVALLS